MKSQHTFCLAGALILAGFCASAVCAQETQYVGDEPVVSSPAAVEGIPLGEFLLFPEIGLSGLYDTNIFATRDNEVDDVVTVLYPNLSARSQWQEHSLNFEAGGAFARYQSNDDEDYDDYWVDVDGRYDFSPRTNVFGGAGFASEHEDRSSPDDTLAGNKPTTYDSRSAHGGLSHRFNSTTVRLGGTFERLDFDDVKDLDNDDRDRDEYGAGARATFDLNRRYAVFLQGVWDKRVYEREPDDNGFQRDSDGYRAGLGVKARLSNTLRGQVFLGYLNQDYDDESFSTVEEPDFGARLNWLVSPSTTLTAVLDRSLEETTIAGASSYLYTRLSAALSHRFTSRLRLSVNLSVGREDYQDINRKDDVFGGELGLRYVFDPRFYVSAGYRVTARDSSFSDEVNNPANEQDPSDYGRNQVFVTLGVLLYPVAESNSVQGADQLDLTRSDVIWPGFYVGTQVGSDSLHVESESQKDLGFERADLSDAAAAAGLFAGYGFSLNRWYLGLELEADKGWVDVSRGDARPDSRTVEVEKKHSYGLAARFGYTVPNGVLLYARAGAVRSEFKTSLSVNNLPQNASDESSTETGLRYGLGADIPATDRLFVRMDYSYTNYDSYEAEAATEVERLDPSDNVFRLGLGWHFGARGEKSTGSEPVDLGGFYAGAQVGHGSLQSHVSGTIQEGAGPGPGPGPGAGPGPGPGSGGAGPFDFDGDFGAQKGVTTGLFAGFGWQWRRWYAALEAELEMGTVRWKHVSEPAGRDFSVRKKDTQGLSLRGGYVLGNGTLLYVRAGAVNTRFNTEWAKGGDRDNDIDRDDTELGRRYGLGSEIPIHKNSFLRLDYTYTDYRGYDFVTSHTNPDDIRFANSETLFRVAVGARF